MKILIQDYTNLLSTESRFLYTELQGYNQIQTQFFSPQQQRSAYDIMDSFQPDFIIADALGIHKDLIHYGMNNDIKNKLILRVNDDLESEQINFIESNEFVRHNVCFFIGNKSNKNKIKYVNLRPCADDHIPIINLKQKIPLCIISNAKPSENLTKDRDCFHVISFEENSNADLVGPNINMAGLYSNYECIIFDKIKKFQQPFFDAISRCDNVYFNSEDNELSKKSIEIFGQDLKFGSDVNFEKVKKLIQEKHTPRNRVKQLLSNMPIDQSIFTEVNK